MPKCGDIIRRFRDFFGGKNWNKLLNQKKLVT